MISPAAGNDIGPHKEPGPLPHKEPGPQPTQLGACIEAASARRRAPCCRACRLVAHPPVAQQGDALHHAHGAASAPFAAPASKRRPLQGARRGDGAAGQPVIRRSRGLRRRSPRHLAASLRRPSTGTEQPPPRPLAVEAPSWDCTWQAHSPACRWPWQQAPGLGNSVL